jgi:3-oxoacyl-[acyl-carrier-protein] synthase-3
MKVKIVLPYSAAILGTGIFLPNKIVRNNELENLLGLEQGFIESRTGILERRWCGETDTIESMAVVAAINATKDANVGSIQRIIIVRDAIITKRAMSIGLPIMKGLAKEGIDVSNCHSIDIINYCPGFIHALDIANLSVGSGEVENVLVVASTAYDDIIITKPEFHKSFGDKFELNELVSQYSLGPENCFQAPKFNMFLWGCGAGAMVVGRSEVTHIGHYNARSSERIKKDIFGFVETPDGRSFASLDGTSVYRFAMSEVFLFIKDFLHNQDYELEGEEIIVPHQPNPRILKDLLKKLEMPESKMLITCDMLGNMIGASIPITYHLARKDGRIRKDQVVLLCSFGDSYLTVAGIMIQN